MSRRRISTTALLLVLAIGAPTRAQARSARPEGPRHGQTSLARATLDAPVARLAALWPFDQPAQTPHPAVARVIASERGAMSLGSGTLVDANESLGLVVTNWHVVKDAQGPIEVVFPNGFRSGARVVRMDREWDLASLLIRAPPGVQPVRVTREAARPGETLSIAGYGSGNYKMQAGRCTQYLAPGANRPFEIVELAAAARQGDSGGPILNSRGELAGVLFGEGGGRTSGSYGGRVHNFLQLTAMDLQRMPAANIAGRPATPASGTVARFNGRIGEAPGDEAVSAAASGAVAQGGASAPAYESAAARVAARPAGKQWDGDSPRPLVIAPPRYKPGEGSPAVASRTKPGAPGSAARSKGIWFIWGNELKSLLAAFGGAAILLQALQWIAGRR